MYKHVLCVYPYREDIRRRNYYPPLGLEIIAGALEPHSRRIDVVDLRHDSGGAADYLRAETDLVCFSINWDNRPEFIREQIAAVRGNRLVIAGGRHASELPGQWMADCPGIDVLVRGDGEEAIAELARGAPPETVAGVTYRRGAEVVHTPNRHCTPISDDCLPLRRRRSTRYAVDFRGVSTGVTVDTVAASRGCPFHCRFCSFNMNPWGVKRPYSARSVESVIDELGEIEAEIVVFTDDVFTHDMDRVEALCDQIRARGIHKRFVVNSRIEIARRMDVVHKMEKAGFVGLLLGVESAQDKTLLAMRKGFDTARIREHFAKLRRTRMLLHGYFILGAIGETEEEMLEIAPFARSIGLDTVGLSPLRTRPHDGLQDLIAASPGYHVSPQGFVYSDRITRERLRRIRRRIWRSFYTPSHLLRLSAKCLRDGMFSPRLIYRVVSARVRESLPKALPEFLRRRPRPARGAVTMATQRVPDRYFQRETGRSDQ